MGKFQPRVSKHELCGQPKKPDAGGRTRGKRRNGKLRRQQPFGFSSPLSVLCGGGRREGEGRGTPKPRRRDRRTTWQFGNVGRQRLQPKIEGKVKWANFSHGSANMSCADSRKSQTREGGLEGREGTANCGGSSRSASPLPCPFCAGEGGEREREGGRRSQEDAIDEPRGNLATWEDKGCSQKLRARSSGQISATGQQT